MRTRTKAKPAALLLLALFAAILLAVHGMPSVGAGTSAARDSSTGSSGAAQTHGGPPAGEGAAAGAVGAGFGLGVASAGDSLPFTVTGGVTGLAPGLWRPVAATVHNPNSVAIRVTSLELSVTSDSFPPGCRTSTNLEIRQGSLGASGRITVPAGRSVTLVQQGGTDPRIRLRDLPTVNQDVCKGKSFTLVWSGRATG
jgi:hypothetical protein